MKINVVIVSKRLWKTLNLFFFSDRRKSIFIIKYICYESKFDVWNVIANTFYNYDKTIVSIFDISTNHQIFNHSTKCLKNLKNLWVCKDLLIISSEHDRFGVLRYHSLTYSFASCEQILGKFGTLNVWPINIVKENKNVIGYLLHHTINKTLKS